MARTEFKEFLSQTASRGEVVNILFEERLFDLVGVLDKITGALTGAGIPHELIDGLAVLVHVEEADPSQSTLTRDVDLMIRREDLERCKEAASRAGFRFRHAAGVDMLLYGDTDRARNAVHLILSGEKVRPSQARPNPPIAPEVKRILGKEVMVIPVAELLVMKLCSFRDKDRVHVRCLDACGLITPEIEGRWPDELRERLRHVRETE